jgi:hypothetical protein
MVWRREVMVDIAAVIETLSAPFPSLTLVTPLQPVDSHARDRIEAGLTVDPLPVACAEIPPKGAAPPCHLAERANDGEAVLRQLGLVPRARPGQDSTQRQGLILLRSGTARRAVLVFNGIADRFALSRLLIMEQSAHVILVKDPDKCFGLLGIPELGADYGACLSNLCRILAALGAEEVYCIGFSAGGAPALKFGMDLDVRGILGFSIPTTLDLRDDAGAEMNRYPQLVRLYRRARHLGTDLAAEYAARRPRPSLMLVHSRRHARDAWLAGRMGEIEGVTLLDTTGYDGHDTHHWCVRMGLGRSLIERLFAQLPVRG